MSEQELMRLAERCEAATGADRELDGVIQRALGPDYPVHFSGAGVCNAFTASLDAAMMLAPEGCLAEVWRGSDGEGSATCSPLRQINLPRRFAATPALALCAAALRARAQVQS